MDWSKADINTISKNMTVSKELKLSGIEQDYVDDIIKVFDRLEKNK